MSIVCYSSFTFSYLNRARVLAESLKKHHPDWTFVALLTDIPPEGMSFDLAAEPFDEIKWAPDLEIENFKSWSFKHNIIEVCTAVKGPFILELLDRGFDKVFYLDPDTAVLSPLDSLVESLEHNDLLLTPHQLTPDSTDVAILDNEIGSLKWGIYNLGFVGVANRGDGRRFAHWWRDRMLKYCFDDVPAGLFVDQRWCDLAPAFFEKHKIVRDPGCNVASWNLSNRNLSIDLEGNLLANGSPLKFFHFTKLGVLGDKMTERYALDNIEVYELWSWYKRNIDKNTDPAIPNRYWHYGTYDNGETITTEARHLYRHRLDLQNAFPDPYVTEGNSFYAWLGANEPEKLKAGN